MRFGKLVIHLLSDGAIKLDGGAMFGQVPKVVWERLLKADRKNRIRLGLNCFLISSGSTNILVDVGVGSKENERIKELYGLGNSRLLHNLREVGVHAKDIHYVVLSHLHFDHCGGCTKRNRKGEAVPTFPKAKYLIQRVSWEDAIHPNERGRASFRQEDILPLLEREQVEFLDGDAELAPGIWLKVTNGHCRGHQIVLVNQNGAKAAFFGDLIPTPHHLSLPYITAFDQFPEETLERKRELLAQAERERWLILFAHGYENRAGYLEQRSGKLILKPAIV